MSVVAADGGVGDGKLWACGLIPRIVDVLYQDAPQRHRGAVG